MKRALMVLLASVVAVGLVSSPASAQTKVRKDKVGDAPAFVDIRSVRVQDNVANFAMTVRFQRVKRGRTATSALVIPGPRENHEALDHWYKVISIPISRGRWTTRLLRLDIDDGTESRVPCPGLTGRWKRGSRGLARLVVPQSCFGVDAGRQAVAPESFDKRDGERQGDEAARGDSLESIISVRRG